MTTKTKAVEFTIITKTKEDMENKIAKLLSLCNMKNLELRKGKYIGSCRQVFFDDHCDFRFTLLIVKTKEVTYNEIYKMVNSIKPVPFKIVSL